MKEKRPKSIDTVIEDYLQLSDEKLEVPLAIAAAREKKTAELQKLKGHVIKKSTADNLFKNYNQILKWQERQLEIVKELEEVEFTLREFLSFLEGNQLSYEKKDVAEKQKLTYLFWLEDGVIKSNR